ncbi:hypothetical protein BH10PSE1_BH10PSE1_28620 [soil metagenome]
MRVLKGLVLAAAITPLLSACVIYDSSADDTVSVRLGSTTTTASSATLETLRAVRFDQGALVVQADSNGCTDETSFAVNIADGEGPAQLTLTRERPDNCKALVPDGVELRWTYAELGLEAGATAVVSNPVRLP